MSRQDPWPTWKPRCLVSVFAIIFICGVAAGILTFIVTLAQALLAASLPVACIWALTELPDNSAPTRAAWAIRALAATAVLEAMSRKEARPCVLAICALTSIASNTTKVPLGLPAGSFVPYSALVALGVAVLLSWEETRTAAGWAAHPFDCGLVPWGVAALSALLSSVGLIIWSVCWVQGKHGSIQDSMGPTLSPLRIVLYSIINGIGEELEFRMLIFGGLMASPSKHPQLWLAFSLALQAAFFAVLHFAGGFPSGVSGVCLLFVWGVFLGALRLWTGSVIPLALLHIQIDIVVFSLLFIEERKLKISKSRTEEESVCEVEGAHSTSDTRDRASADIAESTDIYGRSNGTCEVKAEVSLQEESDQAQSGSGAPIVIGLEEKG